MRSCPEVSQFLSQLYTCIFNIDIIIEKNKPSILYDDVTLQHFTPACAQRLEHAGVNQIL